jgi:hypothetical protein
MRRSRALLARAVWSPATLGVGLVSLSPHAASGFEHGPGVRLGLELGATDRPATYEAEASAPGAAVSVYLERRERSTDLGGRLDAGWALVFSRKVALFPHLGFGITPMRSVEIDISTAHSRYVIAAEPRWLTLGIAPEVQLLGRTLFVSPEIGLAREESHVTLEGSGLSAQADASRDWIWGRLAAGGRLPLGTWLAGGALVAGEITWPSYFLAPAAYRAVLAVFVEMDGSSW